VDNSVLPDPDRQRGSLSKHFPGTKNQYVISDRDGSYGSVVTWQLQAMGIRDKPISAGSSC